MVRLQNHKDMNNSVENNRVEHVLMSYRVRASIFDDLKESISKKNHVS